MVVYMVDMGGGEKPYRFLSDFSRTFGSFFVFDSTQMTLVVFGFVLIMSLFLWIADKLIEWLVFSAFSWLEVSKKND